MTEITDEMREAGVTAHMEHFEAPDAVVYSAIYLAMRALDPEVARLKEELHEIKRELDDMARDYREDVDLLTAQKAALEVELAASRPVVEAAENVKRLWLQAHQESRTDEQVKAHPVKEQRAWHDLFDALEVIRAYREQKR
jgi:hypothetical protein